MILIIYCIQNHIWHKISFQFEQIIYVLDDYQDFLKKSSAFMR
jgi:hypothetical protein